MATKLICRWRDADSAGWVDRLAHADAVEVEHAGHAAQPQHENEAGAAGRDGVGRGMMRASVQARREMSSIRSAGLGTLIDMLIGYVSDERYLAPPEVQWRFSTAAAARGRRVARRLGASRLPAGRIPRSSRSPGSAQVQRCQAARRPAAPVSFAFRRPARLRLAEVGARREVEFGSTPPNPTSWAMALWPRDEFAAARLARRAWSAGDVQVLPDGDCTQTGALNEVGYASSVHSQKVAGPERSGCYFRPHQLWPAVRLP